MGSNIYSQGSQGICKTRGGCETSVIYHGTIHKKCTSPKNPPESQVTGSLEIQKNLAIQIQTPLDLLRLFHFHMLQKK